MQKSGTNKKVALVLSGGGIKAAAFHIGACLALRERGFTFLGGTKDRVRSTAMEAKNSDKTVSLYVGSSAGAFIATLLASGYSIESIINAFQIGFGERPVFDKKDLDYLKPIGYRNIFTLNHSGLLQFIPETLLKKSIVTGGFEAMIKNGVKLNGIFSTSGLEKYLRQEALLVNDFSNLGVDLFITATQLNHTRKAIFGNFPEPYKTKTTKYINYSSISEAVACSTALPPAFSPYGIPRPDGKEIFYYDGEIRDTLSSHIAADHGADLVISSYTIQPYHFNEKMGSLHKYGIPVIINQALYQVVQQKIAKHIQHQVDIDNLYKAIDRFCLESKMPENQRDGLLKEVQNIMHYRPETQYIYIHPRPENYEMFFIDHFSLNPQLLWKVFRFGFKSALYALKKNGL